MSVLKVAVCCSENSSTRLLNCEFTAVLASSVPKNPWPSHISPSSHFCYKQRFRYGSGLVWFGSALPEQRRVLCSGLISN